MNEEQLANLLAEQLDALLAGAPAPEGLPDEVAELLTIAQTLSETAPTPRPEFGPALKESLLGSAGGNGATPSAGSTFTGQLFFFVLIGLLILATGLALIIGGIIFGTVRSNLLIEPPTRPAPTLTQPAGSPSPAGPPVQTQSAPVIQTPSSLTPTGAATAPALASPTLAATPIGDVLPAITDTVEIRTEPPDLITGPNNAGGNGGGGDGGSGGGGGDDDDDDDDGGDDDD